MEQVTHWILASRPKTLPAAAVPVCVGGALATAEGAFAFTAWFICLAFALLIQIGTNFANDYYDFLKGADGEDRIGPQRAVASGWITPGSMKLGMYLTFLAAFLVGCLLIPFGGWWLLPVGIVSILCGIAYTGGPYPLGYNGWGEVFVFLFFGWVATGITYYVQAGTFSVSMIGTGGIGWTWLAGIVPGALATNLLVVNNVRDEPLDKLAGKRTLAVRFGRRFGLAEYAVLSGLAFIVPLLFATMGGRSGCYLVALALPLAILANRQLWVSKDRAAYEKALVQTALLLLLAGGLFSLGLAI